MADNTSKSKSSGDHPRDEDGKFTDKDQAKSSASGSAAKDGGTKAQSPQSPQSVGSKSNDSKTTGGSAGRSK